ncbi:MAG: hypothetical protein HW387_1295 [Parachlamydiales bacterium]|nr:hypothetical protein [Parachlamydiales bacterium]
MSAAQPANLAPELAHEKPVVGVLADDGVHQPRYWTDVKVKKAWAYAASGLALAGAAVALGFALSMPCLFLLGAAIPLAIASVAVAIYSKSLIDYEDPKTQESLRRKAPGMPLPKVVEKHGWARIFRYRLLDEFNFQCAYDVHAENLSFSQICALYRDARKGQVESKQLNPIDVPLPIIWKGKFESETKNLNCLAILDGYSVSELKEFGIITDDQKHILDDAASARNEFNRRHSALEQEFRNNTPEAHNTLHNDSLSCAQQVRDQSIAAAQEQFRRATEPERQRINALHAQNKAIFDEQMAQYDRQFIMPSFLVDEIHA